VLGVIGPNGAGKTTLFECHSGILPVDAGGVVGGGNPLTRREQSDRLFYVPDQIGPWPSKTVQCWISRSDSSAACANDSRASRALRLQPLLKTRLGALSKGQRSERCSRSDC
jgi:ABC-type multidrug transport system ATPase subunit